MKKLIILITLSLILNACSMADYHLAKITEYTTVSRSNYHVQEYKRITGLDAFGNRATVDPQPQAFSFGYGSFTYTR